MSGYFGDFWRTLRIVAFDLLRFLFIFFFVPFSRIVGFGKTPKDGTT